MTPRTRFWSALVALALALGTASAASEEQAGAPPAPDAAHGRALFEAAARWLRAGRPALEAVQRVRADLQDVTVEGRSGGSHDGHSRIWLDLPHRFRWELRKVRNLPLAKRTVKVLDGARAWRYEPPQGRATKGRWERLHANANNPGAVAQLQKDRDMFAGLARYLTLHGLDGKGVTFRDEGIVSFRKGHHLQGRWLKLRRTGPEGARMAFLFAFIAGRAAGAYAPREPHAVLIPGDPKAGTRTEHILLTRWRLLRGRRVPASVKRWTRGEGGRFTRTLSARIAALEINPPFPPTLFTQVLEPAAAKAAKR